jgi:hypothetical protein
MYKVVWLIIAISSGSGSVKTTEIPMVSMAECKVQKNRVTKELTYNTVEGVDLRYFKVTASCVNGYAKN